MVEVYGIPETWVQLAEDDQSEAYEVDIASIYIDEQGLFVLATASGCSCWSGEWDTETYPTLDALANATVGVDRQWHYSQVGYEKLVAEAREALPGALAKLSAQL